MSDEIFDLVNDRDRVIGRQTRREVHLRGLKHRATHVLVFNARGEVFLQKRSLKKDSYPGAWDSSASGHVNSGEAYDTCAQRELQEEIGLKPARAPRRLFKLEAGEETDQEFVWVYRCDSEGPFRVNMDEIEHAAWFRPDHVTRWLRERPRDFAGAFRLVWQRLLAPARPVPAAAKVKKAARQKPRPKPRRKPAPKRATRPRRR